VKTIGFIIQARPDLGAVTEVVPSIDGAKLTDLVSDFEHRAGMESGSTPYGGLIPAYFNFGPLDLHFLGASSHHSDGVVPLLGCTCGEWGCWPLLARIVVAEDSVTWTDFQQPYHKERDYSGFGPFSFELRQYKSGLAQLLAATVP
jgi:hypothetical protein